MQKPIIPNDLSKLSLHELEFNYLPQLLHYYALQGFNFNSSDETKNINHCSDFQTLLSAIKAHPGYNRKYDETYTNSFWKRLVYIWIFQPEYDIEGFIEYLEKNTTEDLWWNMRERRSPEFKNVRDHWRDFKSKIISTEVILAVHDFSNAYNSIYGLEYLESHYGDIGLKYGTDERTRTINYLKFLVVKFKNYQEVFEDYYTKESDDLIDCINEA